jgi:hypothetical protein
MVFPYRGDKVQARSSCYGQFKLALVVGALANILTVKSAVTNTIRFLSDKTHSPLIQECSEFLTAEKPRESNSNPRESVERRAGNHTILYRNQGKVQYLWFNDFKAKIYLTIFHTDPLIDLKQWKLSDVLEKKEQVK